MKRVLLVLILVAGVVLGPAGSGLGSKGSPAERYYDIVEEGVAHSRRQLPAITASAEKAAKLFVAGGDIYADGSQEQFDVEARNRAGGLMALKWLPNNQGDTPAGGDVVLYGVRGKFTEEDLKKIGRWRADGVYVVVFGTKELLKQGKAGPRVIIDSGKMPGLRVDAGGERKLVPVDTVINTINLWVWTGELASACTRLGKMPVYYQSYSRPGGIARARKYSGKRFHDDLEIRPIAPGVLGRGYLANVSKYLAAFNRTELPKLRKAARWLRDTESKDFAATITIGHLFPGHFQDPRAPQMSAFHRSDIFKQGKSPYSERHFVFFCGYQSAPEEAIGPAIEQGFKLVYVSVEDSDKAKRADNIIYLNPSWPLSDGCVSVPGYDVPILPASGVVNATIYWALLAECLSD